MKKEQKQFYAQRRQMASAIGSVNVGHVTTNAVGISTGDTSVPFTGLPRGGGTMEGPIGFDPNSITISGGKLTMANLLTTPTSWCIATGEGSAADDLFYIITQNVGSDVGAWFSGQILILQAGVYNITLKHRGTSASNIYIPSGSDLTLTGYTSGTSTGGEIAILMYDDQVVGGEWILVATSKPLGGGGVTNPVNATLSLGGNQITRVTSLFFDGDGNNSHSIQGNTGGINYLVDNTDEFHDFKVDGVIKLRVGNTYIQCTDALDMDDDVIQNVNILYMNASGTSDASIDGQSTGLLYKVASGDEHQFLVNSVERMVVTSSDVEIKNWIDIKSPVTTVPSSAGSGSTEVEYGDIHGWVKIQIDGGNYSFPVWAL